MLDTCYIHGSFRISVSDDYNSIWFSGISIIRVGQNYRDKAHMSKSGFLPSRSNIGALGWLESLLMNSPIYNVQSNLVNMDTEAGGGGWGVGHRKCPLY